MPLKELLFEKLKKGQMSRDELRNYGRSIKTNKHFYGYDLATTDRKLRELTKEGKIKPIRVGGYNVFYKIVTKAEPPFKDLSQLRSEPLDEETENTLDERLISLLTKNRLGSINAIREINRAIKSKELFIKRSALEKYE